MFEDYMDKFHQWGADRGIITNGKAETQVYKLLSEFGEMCDAIAKGEDLYDHIGDQVVVLAMIAGIVNHRPRPLETDEIEPLHDEVNCLIDSYLDMHTKLCCTQTRFVDRLIDWSIENLARIAQASGISFEDCLETAWSEIKDRKGYLNEHGVFIKEVA